MCAGGRWSHGISQASWFTSIPLRPPNPGDFVLVLVREPQFATPIGYVRQYLGEDADESGWATLNPKRAAAINRKALVSIATIVGSGLL